MSDAQTLINLVCQESGLDNSIGSADRAIALSSLNRAFRNVAKLSTGFPDIARFTTTFRDTKILPSPEDASLASTADGDDSSNIAVLSLLVALDWIGVSNTTGATEVDHMLDRVGAQRIMQLRPQLMNTAHTPSVYAVNWPLLMFDSMPSTGINLVMGYRRMPILMTDSSSSFPYELHPLFHEDLLAKWAMVLILEGFEGREQDAAYHRGILNQEISEYKQWMLREGGIDYQNDGTRVDAWSTPWVVSTRSRARLSSQNWGGY